MAGHQVFRNIAPRKPAHRSFPASLHQFLGALLLGALLPIAAPASPAVPSAANPARVAGNHAGIFLVFPFENAGAPARLDWLGEALEELTILRLSAVGEAVYSHEGRSNELDRYGLPPEAKLSHATMLRIALDLDADYVIFGTFASDGSTLTVESRILRVNPAALLPVNRESGPLETLMDLQIRLAWRTLSSQERSYPLSLAEFAKKQRPLRLDAFEHYVRGLLDSDDEARLRELREAARLEPDWPEPDFWLGQVYFSRRDCNSALPWYARVPKTHDRYSEAVFATGVCRLLLSQPDRAQEVFTGLRESLRAGSSTDPGAANVVAGGDLPEILNNLALAKARLGDKLGAQTDLQRAADLDPDEDDYAFNLGLLALQGNDAGNAAGYFREAAEREPDNSEDRALLIYSLDKAGRKQEADQERIAATEAFGPSGLPAIRLDSSSDTLTHMARIKTELDTTELRQEIKMAEIASVNASASVPLVDSAESHIRRARQELAAGHVDVAEREFHAALALDGANPSAHRGLADIARRQGKLDEAVAQLQAALQSRDSAVGRVILARIYLEQKKPDQARVEAQRALKLAPNYAEAKELLGRLQGAKPGATP
ncbi:MAG: tetratricopeptide repeat protein [Candidatus Acidiferrum sp.]|jgi:tetratricopeptide (TPR) repeat protein